MINQSSFWQNRKFVHPSAYRTRTRWGMLFSPLLKSCSLTHPPTNGCRHKSICNCWWGATCLVLISINIKASASPFPLIVHSGHRHNSHLIITIVMIFGLMVKMIIKIRLAIMVIMMIMMTELIMTFMAMRIFPSLWILEEYSDNNHEEENVPDISADCDNHKE